MCQPPFLQEWKALGSFEILLDKPGIVFTDSLRMRLTTLDAADDLSTQDRPMSLCLPLSHCKEMDIHYQGFADHTLPPISWGFLGRNSFAVGKAPGRGEEHVGHWNILVAQLYASLFSPICLPKWLTKIFLLKSKAKIFVQKDHRESTPPRSCT